MKRNYRILAVSDYDSVRDFCNRVKTGDKDAIKQIARTLSSLVPTGKTLLVPVPGHDGKAGYTLELAQAISREANGRESVDALVLDCLACDPHESLCEIKRSGGNPLDVELNVRFRDLKAEDAFNSHFVEGRRVLLVDNVADTGLTARSCMDVVDDCDVLCIGNTLRDTQAQFYPEQPGRGVPVHVHFQNIEDDSTLYDMFCDKVYLPCCPAIGDTFFTDGTTQRNVLRKILRYHPFDLYKWGNCVADPDGSPYLTFRRFFHVVDRWFRGSDGSLRETPGYVQAFLSARRQGKAAIIPRCEADRLAESGIDLSGADVYGAERLAEVIRIIRDRADFEPVTPKEVPDVKPRKGFFRGLDENTRRTAVICAAGGHGLLMEGWTGDGFEVAKAIAGLMPEPDAETRLEAAAVRSLAGIPAPVHRAVRAPLAGVSTVALMGGGFGDDVLPGEVSLAHGGVLAIGTEGAPKSLFEALRAPLEDGKVTVARLKHKVEFPAEFIPVVNLGDADEKRHDTEIARLGPLYDRLDVQSICRRVPEDGDASEAEWQAIEDVARARLIQERRYGQKMTNAEASPMLIEKAGVDDIVRDFVDTLVERMGYSARSYSRILRIARTIADLEGSDRIGTRHLAEAASYRYADRIPQKD